MKPKPRFSFTRAERLKAELWRFAYRSDYWIRRRSLKIRTGTTGGCPIRWQGRASFSAKRRASGASGNTGRSTPTRIPAKSFNSVWRARQIGNKKGLRLSRKPFLCLDCRLFCVLRRSKRFEWLLGSYTAFGIPKRLERIYQANTALSEYCSINHS
jgi:hypothetical protein